MDGVWLGSEVGLYNCSFSNQLTAGSFLFFTDFFFILNYAYVCISVRQYVHMHADVPGSQKSIVFPGAGVAGNCERPTR